MRPIPRDPSFDGTLDLLADPYRFIQSRCELFGADVFQTRLLLETTLCMLGSEAAAVFYDPARFMRSGAAPRRVRKTLFGEGGVQTLDDDGHRRRKAMVMSLMTRERIDRLVETVIGGFDAYAGRWAAMEQVFLYDEVQRILATAVCAWAGVPLMEGEVRARTRELAALYDFAGAVGPAHWWSRLARKRANAWALRAIRRVRERPSSAPEETAVHAIAHHRDANGNLLEPPVAAVELLNVLRPTVAVAVYITFVAHALHAHPDALRRMRDGEADYTEPFVQEVRRFYPFFPAIAGRVRDTFEWSGYTFPAGTLVLLDLYGTNHDPRSWNDPFRFDPLRFRSWSGSPYDFIPQGGGDHHSGHRCAGERLTIELMKAAARFLARSLRYDVPPQDLDIDFRRLPALPRSRFVITNVKSTL